VAGGPEAERQSAWLARLKPASAPGTATRAALSERRPRMTELTPEHVPRVTTTEADAQQLLELGLRWWVVVPMLEDDRLLGLVHFGLRGTRGVPSEETMELLEDIGQRAARGLANTQLIAELRSTRERLDRILGVLAEAITVHDRGGRIVYANEAAARLMRADSVEHLLTRTGLDLVTRFDIRREDGTPVTLADFPGAKLLAGQPAEPLLARAEDPQTGDARWVLTKATLLEDDGAPLAVNVIEDVTDAKVAERRQRFLAYAGEVLGSSLDYDQTLEQIAGLAVPEVADLSVLDVIEEDGSVRRIARAGDGREARASPRRSSGADRPRASRASRCSGSSTATGRSSCPGSRRSGWQRGRTTRTTSSSCARCACGRSSCCR
jgi:PAS domain-containing protein